MKVLCVGDLHLKLEMLEKAEKAVEKYHPDIIVLLGDLVDDWGQQDNLALYKVVMEKFHDFMKKYQNTLFCYGNHDLAYSYNFYVSGSSHLPEIRTYMKSELDSISSLYRNRAAIAHRIDNYIFSHGGLSRLYCESLYWPYVDDIDLLISHINDDIEDPDKTWWDHSNSPIWFRPQYSGFLYPRGYTHVVGHTPVSSIQESDALISCDTWSTYNGQNLGDQSFLLIDTDTREITSITSS